MIHPETGEVLETREQFQAALELIDEQLGLVYRYRRPILEAYAEQFETAEMPPARSRTQVQERVARCPRCGSRLEKDEG